MSDKVIAKHVYLLNKTEMLENSWCANVKNILSAIGMEQLFEMDSAINIAHARQLLLNDYNQAWKHAATEKSKLDLFIKLKDDFKVASHITVDMPKNKRSLISQLRLGVLPVQQEVGRFTNTPREQRICKLCEHGVEDEAHFLFDCVKLDQERNKLAGEVPEILSETDCVDKLKFLTKRPHVFSKFVLSMWESRLNYLSTLN